MNTPENPNNDAENGFGYGQLEHGELNMGSEKKDFGSALKSRLDLCISYLSLGKREVWTKIKESNLPKYINEHRVGTLVIFILILFCFSILLHLSLQVKAGINTQNKNGKYISACTMSIILCWVFFVVRQMLNAKYTLFQTKGSIEITHICLSNNVNKKSKFSSGCTTKLYIFDRYSFWKLYVRQPM